MTKADRPDELADYEAFQRAVVDGFLEAARLDESEPVFVPYGRCRVHPSVSIFEHGFDTLCHLCEEENNESAS